MSRSAALIQVQIDAMEAVLPDLIKYANMSDGPTSVARQNLKDFQEVLNELYNQLAGGGRSVSVSSGVEFTPRDSY